MTMIDGEHPVFPFHWCCYEFLALAFTGERPAYTRWGGGDDLLNIIPLISTTLLHIEKDILYNVFKELSESYAPRLCLDFDDPVPPCEEIWWSKEGEEIFVSNPSISGYLLNHTNTILTGTDFKPPSLYDELPRKVTFDAFDKLPYDVIDRICSYLPPRAIVNLIMASKKFYTDLRHNGDFWKQCIKRTMPWFFELLTLLEKPDSMEGKDPMGLFVWADRETMPRTFMSGPFMAIANRRRIWGMCEKLRDRRVQPGAGKSEKIFHRSASCDYMHIVSHPIPAKKSLKTTFWVDSYEVILTEQYIVETFWDDQGALIGISVAPEGQRRLFGKDDTSDDSILKQIFKIDKGDWIEGFILHISETDICDANRPPARKNTFPTGIWVVLSSGKESYMGRSDMNGAKRLLTSSYEFEGLAVGIEGEVASIKGKERICSLGLLEVGRDHPYDSPYPENTFKNELANYLWKDDYSSILHSRIWATETIRLSGFPRFGSEYKDMTVRPSDIIPHEALIWGKDINELQCLIRLSAYMIKVGTTSGLIDGVEHTWDFYDLCGMRAEFTPESHIEPRIVGTFGELDRSSAREQRCVDFDIDGPGGERINEVRVSRDQNYMGLKLRTNRNREADWGEQQEGELAIFEEFNVRMLGIVVTFGIGAGFSRDTRSYTRTRISSVAVLELKAST
ncbi:hypothetical protein F5884DRAFT_830110 [Xylogone sp. PMI_703]|nr:hypothetical protein F5884DRAFT_830110 [Xylogone sp. PMI_703]